MHKIVISHVSQFNLDPWGYNPVAQKRDTLKWVIIYICDAVWFWYTHRLRLRFPYGWILEQSWFVQRGPLLVINLSHNPCRWRYKWVIGVITPMLISGITLPMTVDGSYLVGFLIFRWKTCLPAKANEVDCLQSNDFRFGFYITQTVSKQQQLFTISGWFIYILYIFMQKLRIVAFFLLDVSKSLFTERDSERPMVYWRGWGSADARWNRINFLKFHLWRWSSV